MSDSRKIIQTPSHLDLFEKVIHNDKITDYRDAMGRTCDRQSLVKTFFDKANIIALEQKLNRLVENKYSFTVKNSNIELVMMIMTNIYTCKTRDESVRLNAEILNSLVLSEGVEKYYQHLVGHEKYMIDRNSRHRLMEHPKLMSSKASKQLPKFSYL